jgi:hypothetical protein
MFLLHDNYTILCKIRMCITMRIVDYREQRINKCMTENQQHCGLTCPHFFNRASSPSKRGRGTDAVKYRNKKCRQLYFSAITLTHR